jgi:hypothetical protein
MLSVRNIRTLILVGLINNNATRVFLLNDFD